MLSLLVAACAARLPYAVRSGDQAFKRGEYQQAIELYQSAVGMNFSQKSADKRIAKTRQAWMEQELKEAAQAFDEGHFDEAIDHLANARRVLPDAPEIDTFMKERLASALAAIEGLHKEGKLGPAYVRANRVATLFESKKAAKRATEIGEEWATKLKARAEKLKNTHEALLVAGALDAIESQSRSASAYADLRAKHRLTVAFSDGGGARAHLGAIEGTLDSRFVRTGGIAKVDVSVTLGREESGVDVTSRNEVQQYENGTRSVENPERVAIEEEVAGYREEIAKQDEEIAYYLERGDQPNDVEYHRDQKKSAQDNLDFALSRLESEPVTIEEPNYEEYTYAIETHTLWLERDVQVSVGLDGPGSPIKERFGAKAADDTYGDHPQIGLSRDPLQLPAVGALRPELDAKIIGFASQAVLRSYDTYRARVLAQASGGKRREGLALYVLLSGSAADAKALAELEGLTEIPNLGALVDGMASGGSLAQVFAPDMESASERARQRPAPPTPPSESSTSTKSTVAVVGPTGKTAPIRPEPAPPTSKAKSPEVEAFIAKYGQRNARAEAFEILDERGVVAKVSKDGQVEMYGVRSQLTKGVIGSENGAIAVTKKGELVVLDHGKHTTVGSFRGDVLMAGGGELELRRDGHFEARENGGVKVSRERVSPVPRVRRLPVTMAIAMFQRLHFSDAPDSHDKGATKGKKKARHK